MESEPVKVEAIYGAAQRFEISLDRLAALALVDVLSAGIEDMHSRILVNPDDAYDEDDRQRATSKIALAEAVVGEILAKSYSRSRGATP